MSSLNIACHCGHVKIKLTGEPVVDLYCHCQDCQRITGAGCVPYSIYPQAAVEVTEGNTMRWALKSNQRTRCTKCGTYLFGMPEGMGITELAPICFRPALFLTAEVTRSLMSPQGCSAL